MKELLLLSCWILVLVSGSEEPQTGNITAVEGENVILPCEAPNNNQNILVVSWTRPDLEEDQFVFFYRDGHFETDAQSEFYKNRVDLKNREMKNGDVSLILNNVTFNDRGTFECFVCQTGSNDSLTIISLSVDPPGEPEEEGVKEERGKEEGVKEEGGSKEGGGGGVSDPTVTAVIVVVVVGIVVAVMF